MMQHTQYPTGTKYRCSWELENVDYALSTITLSNGESVELEIYQDSEHGWLVWASSISSLVIENTHKRYDPNFDVLDYMESKGVRSMQARLRVGRDFVREWEGSSKDILLTPRGVQEMIVAFPILEEQLEDTYIIYHWARDFKFFGEYAKEAIIKKRTELIKSNADGYMMDSYQLSKSLGVKPDSIRRTKHRHTEKLIEGVHWKYSSNGYKTLLFTKLGCLVMSSLVSTKEAQETKVFLERIFGVTNEELSLAA